MQERKPEITEAVEHLYTLSLRYDRGQVVPWVEIERFAGPRAKDRGKHIITRWRRRLQREREIVTRCAAGIGVRLLTHSEAAREVPKDRQRRAYRQIRRALRETATVNTSLLSDLERRTLGGQRANMASTRRDLFRSQHQLTVLTKPTESAPLRKVPGMDA